MLKLERLRFQYQQTDMDYDFSLNAASGEVIGIMGASGSGKSTLLELIAGFLQPSSGEMLWNDVTFDEMPPGKRPTTVLFQNHNLFEHLTAIQNVALGLNPHGKMTSTDAALILETLKRVGLEGKEHQVASTLSGGQQQRVALARAFVRSQPIVLLDEPFTGLDDDSKESTLELVSKLATEGAKCVLMVTHDASDCDAIADHQYLVEQGRLRKINQ